MISFRMSKKELKKHLGVGRWLMSSCCEGDTWTPIITFELPPHLKTKRHLNRLNNIWHLIKTRSLRGRIFFVFSDFESLNIILRSRGVENERMDSEICLHYIQEGGDGSFCRRGRLVRKKDVKCKAWGFNPNAELGVLR